MNPSRRFSLITFLTWLPVGFYVAPQVLLMLDRGLSVPTIAAVGIAYSVTTAVLELPTGGLADVIGRRAVLLASCAASLAGLLVLGFATTAMVFAISGVLQGVARALGSGPAEAWYVDTVDAAQRSKGLAHSRVAGSTGLAIGTIGGGLIPLAFTGIVAVPLAIPMFAAAAVEAVRLFVIIAAMPEPRPRVLPGNPRLEQGSGGGLPGKSRDLEPREHGFRDLGRDLGLRAIGRTVRDGVRLAWLDPVLLRLVAITGCIGVALATIELLTPPWLATITGTFETAGIAYAIVAALGFAASAVGSSLSPRVIHRAGSPARGAAAGAIVMVVALVLLALATVIAGAPGLGLAALAYFALFVGLGVGSPAFATLTHDRVESSQRATILSIQSLALQAAGVIGVNVLSRASELTSPAVAFIAAAVVIGTSTLALRAIGRASTSYAYRYEAHIHS